MKIGFIGLGIMGKPMVRNLLKAGHEVWVNNRSKAPMEELVKDGIPATLITDGMAASLMAQGKIDLVLLGCDRMAANGDFANKIGTYGVAVLAHYHGIPFYSVLPSSTIDLSIPDGSHIPIEQREASEVTHFAGVRTAPEGVGVYNPAFDVTPHRLLTGIITEKGVIHPPFAEQLAERFG